MSGFSLTSPGGADSEVSRVNILMEPHTKPLVLVVAVRNVSERTEASSAIGGHIT